MRDLARPKIVYLRDSNNHPVGAISVRKNGELITISGSMCHKSDNFNKRIARIKTFARLRSVSRAIEIPACSLEEQTLDSILNQLGFIKRQGKDINHSRFNNWWKNYVNRFWKQTKENSDKKKKQTATGSELQNSSN